MLERLSKYFRAIVPLREWHSHAMQGPFLGLEEHCIPMSVSSGAMSNGAKSTRGIWNRLDAKTSLIGISRLLQCRQMDNMLFGGHQTRSAYGIGNW